MAATNHLYSAFTDINAGKVGSTLDGITWSFGLQYPTAEAISVWTYNPMNPLYQGGQSGSPSVAFFYTHDNWATKTIVAVNPPHATGLFAELSGNILGVGKSGFDLVLDVSTDNGGSWTTIILPGQSSVNTATTVYEQSIIQCQDNSLVTVGGRQISATAQEIYAWRSTDRGITWTKTNTFTTNSSGTPNVTNLALSYQFDTVFLIFDYGSGTHTKGQVLTSRDRGATWVTSFTQDLVYTNGVPQIFPLLNGQNGVLFTPTQTFAFPDIQNNVTWTSTTGLSWTSVTPTFPNGYSYATTFGGNACSQQGGDSAGRMYLFLKKSNATTFAVSTDGANSWVIYTGLTKNTNPYLGFGPDYVTPATSTTTVYSPRPASPVIIASPRLNEVTANYNPTIRLY